MPLPIVVIAVAVIAVLPIVVVASRLRGGAALPSLPRKWTSAGGVVIDRRGRIALVRQRDRKGRMRWTLPKGRIDSGETEAEAALREVYEETGFLASIVRPIVMHEGRLHFTYFFEMTLERDDGEHDRETREVRLVSFEEAAGLLRGRRDLGVLRRLVEMRTRVVAAATKDLSTDRLD